MLRLANSARLLFGVSKDIMCKCSRGVTTSKLVRLSKGSDLGFFFIRKRHIEGSPVFLQVLELFRAWDGEDVIALLQKPCEGELGYGTALLVRKCLEFSNDLDILVSVVFVETRLNARAPIFAVTYGFAPTKSGREQASPRGAAMTSATPSSRHVARRSWPAGPSMSRVNTEYSVWTAATDVILHARRSVVEEIAHSPICFILPSLDYSRQQRRETLLFPTTV